MSEQALTNFLHTYSDASVCQGEQGPNQYTDSAGTTWNTWGSGYTCPSCGLWVSYGCTHFCTYWHFPIYYPYIENKTERAFNVIKALLALKIIREPKTFGRFCELMEAIKKAL